MTLEEFALQHDPLLRGRYRMFNANKKEDLVGSYVCAIRSGFSSTEPGRFMKIRSIDRWGNIHLSDPFNQNERGWGTSLEKKHNDIVFAEDFLEAMDSQREREFWMKRHSKFLHLRDFVLSMMVKDGQIEYTE